jgi:hypothetical protein
MNVSFSPSSIFSQYFAPFFTATETQDTSAKGAAKMPGHGLGWTGQCSVLL